jgi:hypothetical protein
MALAVLLANEPQTRSAFRLLAGWRATDYLRWWRNQPTLDGSPDKNEDAPLSSEELDKACAALNRLLGKLEA